MKKWILGTIIAATSVSVWHLNAACCYFSAKSRDVEQPSQKAFITWEPAKKEVTFTVQPKFEGNAKDFGMVIPTPSQPQLNEMPRDFFELLGTFTIMEPTDWEKFRQPLSAGIAFAAEAAPDFAAMPRRRSTVKVIESGVVGTLDYKIVTAERADDLYQWLRDHDYSYSGDEATLDSYIAKKWFFTVMKIDPKQMKGEGLIRKTYTGEITPTRFKFKSDQLVYPLQITQVSVTDQTEALLYVQAPYKVDLPISMSYQSTWQLQWASAMDMAIPEKLTKQERTWRSHITDHVRKVIGERLSEIKRSGIIPARLEWAKRLTAQDAGYLSGAMEFNREAPDDVVAKLRQLQGHVKQGRFITKIRKTFKRSEMGQDLVFVRASVNHKNDDIEYYQALPADPP